MKSHNQSVYQVILQKKIISLIQKKKPLAFRQGADESSDNRFLENRYHFHRCKSNGILHL